MSEICQYLNMEEPNILKVFKKVDVDKDGKVDYSDFLTAAFDKRQLLTQKNIKRVFKLLDHNNNGYVTKDSLMETLGQADIEQSRENNLESAIDKMDQNKDGRI